MSALFAKTPPSGISALSGKTVVRIAAGNSHSLVLCSDGTLAAWGLNSSGQLGSNTTTNSSVPMLVNADDGTSALFGKTVTSIESAASHNLALCSDGTLAAWGSNTSGQLGDNTTAQRTVWQICGDDCSRRVEQLSPMLGRHSNILGQ
jgi:alpha-tubulin suppressor-like RCC1 family protein